DDVGAPRAFIEVDMHLQSPEAARFGFLFVPSALLHERLALILKQHQTLDASLRKRIDRGQFLQVKFDLVSTLDVRPVLQTPGVMLDSAADIRHGIFESGKLGRKSRAGLVRGKVVLRLVLSPVEIVSNRFEFLESDVDRAVLTARKKQRA